MPAYSSTPILVACGTIWNAARRQPHTFPRAAAAGLATAYYRGGRVGRLRVDRYGVCDKLAAA